MRREDFNKNMFRKMAEGRIARICAVSVSVFLCVLTVFELVALELQWEVPLLSVFVSVEHTYWSDEYQQEELALDESTENELLEELPTDAAAPVANDAAENIAEATESVPIPEEQKETEAAEESVEAPEPEFPYYIRINRKQNCITVYTLDENGEYTVPCRAMICSTGLYNATPRGIFHISTKYRWRQLYGGVYGQYATRIYGGVLFHSVPYYRKDESRLCTDKYNKLGQQASMGCVRLTVEDAKWIAENCPVGTAVEVYDDDDPGPLGKPESVRLDADSPIKGWDPTDPNPENPWREWSEDF